MRFLHPNILWLLILLAGIIVFLFIRVGRQRRELKKFGDTDLVRDLMPDLSLRRKLVKDLVLVAASGLMIVALARPQIGSKSETITQEGIEMIVAMDISNSMLSDDVQPSRLGRAKAIVSKIIDRLDNNKIGLIYFAGMPYVQLPITADMILTKMFLNNATPGMIETQGTDLGQAIRLSLRSFSSDEASMKVIVLITDVENHEEAVLEAVQEAKEKGILVNVIGVGSEQGGPIPLPGGGYLLDENGQMVVTKLNEQLAQEIATASGGIYIRANDVSQTVRVLEDYISKLDQTELEKTVYSAYDELYYIPLLFALLLLAFDFIYLDRKNRYLRKVRLFGDKDESNES